MPKLIYHDSDGLDKVLQLGSEALLIGRATECQVQTQDAMVSRRHARIYWDGNYWIEDLGSSNGVYVGNDKVQKAPFRPGDTVTCGSLVLRLMPDTGPRTGMMAPQTTGMHAPVRTGITPPVGTPHMAPPPAPPPPVSYASPSTTGASGNYASPSTTGASGNYASPSTTGASGNYALPSTSGASGNYASPSATGASGNYASPPGYGSPSTTGASGNHASPPGYGSPSATGAPPPYAPPPSATMPPSRADHAGGNGVMRGPSAPPSATTGAQNSFAEELRSERQRRETAEKSLAQANERARAAESRVAELEPLTKDASLLQRKLDQAQADLRRLRGGQPLEERDDGEATRLRARVAELEAELAAAARAPQPTAPAASDPEAPRLKRQVEQLQSELRRLRAGQPEPVQLQSTPPSPKSDPALADAAIALGDSLAELRSSLRAANDEAGLLTAPGESVQVVGDALRSAAEQLESARAHLRALGKLLGVS